VYNNYPNSTPCDDGNVCTTGDNCVNGICTGSAVNCDDHNPCTEDSCDLVAGCVHTQLADGTACGGGMCGQAVCVQGLCEPVSGSGCEDYDPCTKDWCDPQQGCLHERLPDGYECGKCYMCIGGQCMKATDCSEGGCGCGNTGHELPLWGGLLVLALLVVRRRR
jgi:MYXO-CTERM domain-containing protein